MMALMGTILKALGEAERKINIREDLRMIITEETLYVDAQSVTFLTLLSILISKLSMVELLLQEQTHLNFRLEGEEEDPEKSLKHLILTWITMEEWGMECQA